MHDLPTGTVTFLFTDIEGSTRLLRRLGERYAGVLEEHTARGECPTGTSHELTTSRAEKRERGISVSVRAYDGARAPANSLLGARDLLEKTGVFPRPR